MVPYIQIPLHNLNSINYPGFSFPFNFVIDYQILRNMEDTLQPNSFEDQPFETTPTTPVARVSLQQGLILGLALILFSLLMYLFGVEYQNKIQYLSYLIIVVGLFLTMKQWRDRYNNGYVTYGSAFKNGFLTMLFASILVSIWTAIFYGLIAPGEIDRILEITEERMLENQREMTDEEIEMAMKMTRMFMTPVTMAITGLIFNVIIGTIISAIVGLVIKKEKTSFV